MAGEALPKFGPQKMRREAMIGAARIAFVYLGPLLAVGLALSACSYNDRALDRSAESAARPLQQASLSEPDAQPEAAAIVPPHRAPAPHAEMTADSAQPSARNRPYVVIRFNQPDLDYEQQLYEAMNRALTRKPSATFTVEAVAPAATTPGQLAANTNACRQDAEAVLHSLTQMGMPADRLSLAATMTAQASTDEVRIYVH